MANNDIIVSEMTPASQINTGDLMIMTQPDAQSETGYSTKSGTVLQVSNKMLKGTNYETDLPSFTNKNVLGGMEELKGDIFNLLPVDEASGSIANFETELAAPLQSVLVNIEASGGNGTPDNPNPINGYSEANLTRCGVNLWDEEWEVGSIDPSTGTTFNDPARIRSKNYSPIKGGVEIYTLDPTNNYNIRLFYYDVNKNYLSASIWLGNQTSTTPEGTCYFKFIMGSSYGTTYHNDLAVLYPSNNHTYAPYNGQTYAIAFGQTVYGGVLDVTRGKLHVTYSKEILGDLSWSYDSVNQVFRLSPVLSSLKTKGNILCNTYKTNIVTIYSLNDKEITTWNNYNEHDIIIKDTDYSDAVTFKTALGTMGAYAVYELATPFDIDLTPEVISAIVGTNNVFAGCGGVDVKFKDSIQHYIDKKIAQTQALIL